jgi:hypothetical protein
VSIGDWSITNVDQHTSLSEGVNRAPGIPEAYPCRLRGSAERVPLTVLSMCPAKRNQPFDLNRIRGVARACLTDQVCIGRPSPIEDLYKTLKQKRKVVDHQERLLDHAKQISSCKVTAKLLAKPAARPSACTAKRLHSRQFLLARSDREAMPHLLSRAKAAGRRAGRFTRL